jgi:hypothetical protein
MGVSPFGEDLNQDYQESEISRIFRKFTYFFAYSFAMESLTHYFSKVILAKEK